MSIGLIIDFELGIEVRRSIGLQCAIRDEVVIKYEISDSLTWVVRTSYRNNLAGR